jgi:hypothetical protein
MVRRQRYASRVDLLAFRPARPRIRKGGSATIRGPVHQARSPEIASRYSLIDDRIAGACYAQGANYISVTYPQAMVC